MILLGAAGGDIAGSRFEWNNHRSKDFTLFSEKCFFTDDTVMTMAIAKALLDAESLEDVERQAERCMRRFGHAYPGRGYGGHFGRWLREPDPKPYNSFGNGSAMRVSACGWAAKTAEEAVKLAELVSLPTHNHPEGIKGAQAIAEAIFLARSGAGKDTIRKASGKYYAIDFTLDEIRDSYEFNEICQETVPQALEAFFESTSYEDAVRNAISIGGDSDTLAAIAGSVAEAQYGIPDAMQSRILSYFAGDSCALIMCVLEEFNERRGGCSLSGHHGF